MKSGKDTFSFVIYCTFLWTRVQLRPAVVICSPLSWNASQRTLEAIEQLNLNLPPGQLEAKKKMYDASNTEH